jgi:hypothetical protein
MPQKEVGGDWGVLVLREPGVDQGMAQEWISEMGFPGIEESRGR